MGQDGAKGLLAMRRRGAYTIGQDESSSVIYGMPKVAFEIGAVCKQLPLSRIPFALLEVIKWKIHQILVDFLVILDFKLLN